MVDWYDEVVLPKVWNEVVRRWWDKKVPTDYPATDNEFSLDFGDNKDVVTEMEQSLETESSVIADMVPENAFVQNYVGVYEVEGEGGEHILLSPEPINASEAMAIHYNTETSAWENVENVVVENGYAYGDVATLSPIAVFTLGKEVVESDTAIEGLHVYVANANPVKIETKVKDGDDPDEVVTLTNLASGKLFELPKDSKVVILGGTADGSEVESTSITVVGVEHPNFSIYGGSAGSDEFRSHVGTVNVFVKDSKITSVTGSHYKVRTDKVNITVENSTVSSHIATGQSWYVAKKKDGNKPKPDDTSDFITFDATITAKNTKSELVYVGGNSGYSYTKKSELIADGCEFGWCIAGSSNGRIDNAILDLTNTKCKITQTTNRGMVGTAVVKLGDGCEVTDGIYIAGDASDKTVNGTVDSISYDIDKGVTGPVFLGTNGGVELTDNAIVKSVKYSRSANLTFADNVKDVLGEKLIQK